jgi:hypothetical protein
MWTRARLLVVRVAIAIIAVAGRGCRGFNGVARSQLRLV